MTGSASEAREAAGVAPYRLLCINLERSTDRREAMSARADALGLTVEFIPATLGAALDLETGPPGYQRRRRALTWTGPLTAAEHGCLASHRAALKAFLAGPETCAVVLEDDARPLPEFDATVKRLMALGEAAAAVRLLTYLRDDPGRAAHEWPDGQGLVLRRKWTLGGAATFYTRAGAAALLARTEAYFEAWDNLLGRPWIAGAPILELRRSIAELADVESTIEPGRAEARRGRATGAARLRPEKRERTWWRMATGAHRKLTGSGALRRHRRQLKAAVLRADLD
ncbi:MAG: glycosyltransferase family 25 protein [Pseudomonadota bacterium]